MENKRSIGSMMLYAAIVSAIVNVIIWLLGRFVAGVDFIAPMGGANGALTTVGWIPVIIASVVTAILAGLVYMMVGRGENGDYTFIWIAFIVGLISLIGPWMATVARRQDGYGTTVFLGLMHLASAAIAVGAYALWNWKDKRPVVDTSTTYRSAAPVAAAAAVPAAAVATKQVAKPATPAKVEETVVKEPAKVEKTVVSEPVKAEETKEIKPKETKAAKPAAPAKPDDLKKIEGVGPAIEKLLKAAGFTTFASVADAKTDALQAVLTKAGKRFQTHDPGTWAEQATLARDGKWDALDKLQDELDGGVRK